MSSRDQRNAEAIDRARASLRAAGAEELPPQPWQHTGQPASDADLVRYAAWRARKPDVDIDIVTSGIRLLESARAELDQIEAALLFAARTAGVTWPNLSDALGLRSAQAAQQRLTRVAARLDAGAEQ
ncbi:hypothetical protein E8D34_08750 [Nocardioides sp. GY 10113]|uniref:hypothetical protein n=1 Tax=Nocardioides sp. GY 10113 TaxID=2569761 RepID=UPI0010A928F1|nr:hypothetical protein [Nocardioides sp. GY 10113]TIC87752.1 hypothetical protein E8D34_08750 [Nocardioides sp. GY 10113]